MSMCCNEFVSIFSISILSLLNIRLEKKLSTQKEFYFFVSLLQLFGLKSLPHSNKLREKVTNKDEELKQEIEIEEGKEKCVDEGDRVVDIDDHEVIISLNELIEYLCQYNEVGEKKEEEEEEEEKGQKCEVDDYNLLDMVYECLIIIEQNNIYQVYMRTVLLHVYEYSHGIVLVLY